MLSSTQSLFSGKRLLILFVLLFTVFFTYTVFAQESGAIKKGFAFSFPEKIHKLVLDPLPGGTYSVGAGGDFPTIDSAFNKLSIDGIAGEVILELIDNLYTAPSVQFGFVLNGPIPGAGPNSRVTIKPAENKNVTIEGDNEGLLFLINTSYVTFDGVGLTGSTTLTIHTLQNSSYVYNDALDFINNSDHNVIQNIIFIVEDISRASGSGFWFSQTGSFAPDSNLIQDNFVKQAGDAFFIISPTSAVKGYGNIVRGNQIGSETDSLTAFGIQVTRCENTLIENNIVQNLKSTINGSNQVQTGILSSICSGTIIRNNFLGNFRASNGYSASGIFLGGAAGDTGTDNLVYNNMIYDIQSTSAQSDSRVTGIEIWYQDYSQIYYNSVYLSGSGTQRLGSAALYIGGGSPAVDAKNNILINTRNEQPYYASAIYDYSTSNLTSDYNDLYYEPNGFYNFLVRTAGTNYLNLAQWQTTGHDLNSLNEIVNFISPTDLHINNNYYTLLDEHATPITGIDTDFDGEARNVTTPDIGADEFDLDPNATIWQLQNSHFPSDVVVDDFSAPDNQVCWAVGLKLPLAPYAGYIRTIDGGDTWVCDTIPGLSNSYSQQVFAIDADTAYVTVYKLIGTSGSKGIYKTTDAGVTWVRQEAFNNAQSGPGYIHFFDAQNGLVIGDPNLETYTTTNGGLTWDAVTMPAALPNEYTAGRGDGILAIGNTVWFSTGARLYKSTDKGYTWMILLDEPQYIDWSGGIAFQDELKGIYSQKQVGLTNHLYRKTADGGDNWEILSDPILDQIAATTTQHIPGTEKTYFIGGSTAVTMSGIAASYDGGNTWSMIDTVGSYQFFFPSSTVGWNSPYAIRNIYKYVGPRIVSSVEEEQIEDLVPTGYSLSQNYPNPFNPTTTFRYSVPQTSKVVIKVYDILGNEFATLIDEEKSIGTYELTWNAGRLPSGVYFYQLKAGDYVNTKKMLLIK